MVADNLMPIRYDGIYNHRDFDKLVGAYQEHPKLICQTWSNLLINVSSGEK